MARDLKINITAEGAQAKRELAETERAIDGITGSSQKLDKILGQVTTQTMLDAGRALDKVFGNIAAGVEKAVGAASQIADVAQQLGIGAEAVQKLAFAAKQGGSSLEAVGNAIGIMNRNLSEGGKGTVEALKSIGLDLDKIVQMKPDEAFLAIAEGIRGVPDPMKQSALAMELFGRGGRDLLPAIKAGFIDVGKEAPIMSAAVIDSGDQVGDALDKLHGRIDAMKAAALLPLAAFFVNELPESFQTTILGVGQIMPSFETMALGIMAAGGPVAVLGLIKGAFVALLPFLGPVGLIAAGLAAVYLAWKHWDTIVDFFKGAWQFVKKSVTEIPDFLWPLLGPIGAIVLAFKKWDQIKAIAMAVHDAVKTWLVDKFNAIVASVKSKVDAVTGFFKGMYDSVVGNSYVPDMMTRIEEEFGKLGAIMVDPSVSACVMTTDAFGAMAAAVTSEIDRWTSGLQSKLTQFMGGENSLLGNILKNGLAAMLGPAGPLAGLISKGLHKLGEIAISAAKKMWEGIQAIFGTDEEAKKVNPARDKFLSQFGPPGTGPESGFQQLAAMLTNITGEDGGGSLFRAMTAADTMARFRSAAEAIVSALNAAGIAATINFHRGGMVPGLGEVPARLMGGEGVLTARGVAAVGGPAGVSALNSGVSMSGVEQRLDKLAKRFDDLSDRLVQRQTTNTLLMKYAALMPRS